jgi:hypothetical protein
LRRYSAKPTYTTNMGLQLALQVCLLLTSPSIADVEGRMHQPLASRAKPTVLLFTATDCPISNAYAPEVKRIISAYGPKGVKFYLVHAVPTLKAADAKTHASEYGLKATILLDRKHLLVAATGAKVTPEVCVYVKGEKVYMGRIDDLYYALGRKRTRATTHDLRNALDASLAGRKPTVRATKPLGCYIAPLSAYGFLKKG